MAEKTYAEKYAEQNNVLEKNIAVIRPFLKKISEQYDAGTNFYNDIAILSGTIFMKTAGIYTIVGRKAKS